MNTESKSIEVFESFSEPFSPLFSSGWWVDRGAEPVALCPSVRSVHWAWRERKKEELEIERAGGLDQRRNDAHS